MNVRAFSAGEQITCLGLWKHEAQIWAQDLQTALLRAYVIRESYHGPDHVRAFKPYAPVRSGELSVLRRIHRRRSVKGHRSLVKRGKDEDIRVIVSL